MAVEAGIVADFEEEIADQLASQVEIELESVAALLGEAREKTKIPIEICFWRVVLKKRVIQPQKMIIREDPLLRIERSLIRQEQLAEMALDEQRDEYDNAERRRGWAITGAFWWWLFRDKNN